MASSPKCPISKQVKRDNLMWVSLLLTGTPIQNSIGELWTLLNFLDSQAFANEDHERSNEARERNDRRSL